MDRECIRVEVAIAAMGKLISPEGEFTYEDVAGAAIRYADAFVDRLYGLAAHVAAEAELRELAALRQSHDRLKAACESIRNAAETAKMYDAAKLTAKMYDAAKLNPDWLYAYCVNALAQCPEETK